MSFAAIMSAVSEGLVADVSGTECVASVCTCVWEGTVCLICENVELLTFG